MGRLSLEEKAGLLFITGAAVNADGSIADQPEASGVPWVAMDKIAGQRMNHFNLWEIPGAQALAAWQNNLQRFAEGLPPGIPVTLASDPRNHFSRALYALPAVDFSRWCEALGFGALGDADLVGRFAATVQREYLAVGIRVALHPQIDLATEPRWPRIIGTFGEDARLTARLARAYIRGLQGESLGAGSVACMSKHFPGGGPQREGLDPHFEFQRGQVYPGGGFDYHLIPFEAALDAGTAAIMPYYGVPLDQTGENVAMAFNRAIVTGLLRERYRYDGVVCTDWGVISDSPLPETLWPARAWGVEHLGREERLLKALEAGVDQFGGENCPELVVGLVRDGRLPEVRLDLSVRRLLRLKFRLGLFDDPFVEEARVPEVLGEPKAAAAAAASQRRAMTLLENRGGILPLRGQPRVYFRNVDPATAARYAEVAADPRGADCAVLRLESPWVPVATLNPFARSFHHGDLDFKEPVLAEILALLRTVPTIVVLFLDRPAVIPEIAAAAAGLLVEFGADDAAVLDVIFGRARPEGRLPVELPRSMEAVRRQHPDLPHDSQDPLYPFGFGRSI
jgi:beta-glucosidase